MWVTNLKILALTLGVLAFYTMIANVIPQLQSEVPEALDLASDASPEALVAAGERIYNGAGGCTACHGLGTRAPNLLTDHAGQGTIGARCGTREGGADCKAYLYESLTEPNKVIVSGFEPIMTDMRRQLSNDQIWATVAFLQSQGGEVAVTADDIKKTAPAPAAAGGGTVVPGGVAITSTMDPVALHNEKGCVGCHQLDGKGGAVGPSFDHIGARLTADKIRRAILLPNADTTRGFERFAGTMPQTFGQMFSAAQLEALVQFLASRK
ncbi:MAG: cytochrome c4 [Gemmatimonadaceae bacterium]